jgi:hypothetical protein
MTETKKTTETTPDRTSDDAKTNDNAKAKAAAKTFKPDPKKVHTYTVQPGRSVITAEKTFIAGEGVDLNEVAAQVLIDEGHVRKGAPKPSDDE